MKAHTELTTLLRERGLKVTPQRQAVFRALDGNAEHPTAEAVHALVRAEMPTVSLRTVYSTLHELAAMGEIGELDLGTGAARFDPNVRPHHHLVCDGCGAVFDVEAEFPTIHLPDDHEPGFVVSGTEIVFRGRCLRCRTDDEQRPGIDPGPDSRHTVSADSNRSRGDAHAHG